MPKKAMGDTVIAPRPAVVPSAPKRAGKLPDLPPEGRSSSRAEPEKKQDRRVIFVMPLLWDAVRAEAGAAGVPVSEYIRRAIWAFLPEDRKAYIATKSGE